MARRIGSLVLYDDGMTEAEIAAVIGGTKQNVAQYIHRAVRWLWRSQVTTNRQYWLARERMRRRAAGRL